MKLNCIIKMLHERMIPTPFNNRPANIEQHMDEWWDIELAYAHRLYNKTDLEIHQYQQAQLHLNDSGVITKVAISELYPVEPEIDVDHVPLQSGTDYPVVYKYKNGMYVNDGNHRVSKAFLNKETHINVRLVDMDKLAEELGI